MNDKEKGKWEYHYIGYVPGGGLVEWEEYRCSECHGVVPEEMTEEYKFCPYCGKPMET